jgi:hypothetical protein
LGIDQGPIVIMIENYRTQKIWNRFMDDPLIQLGLQRAGFHAANAIHPELPANGEIVLYQNAPNPFSGQTDIRYRLAAEGFVSLVLHDVRGRAVRTLDQGYRAPGEHRVDLDAGSLAPGVYYYRLTGPGIDASKPCTVLR